MALEYTLMIESSLKLTEVTNLLSHIQDFESQSDYLKAPGIIIYIDYADQEDKAFVKDYFHFTPSLSLCFVQDKFADFSDAHANLIKATMTLLKTSSSNAILDFNGDTVLLRKIKEQLFIYQDESDFWKPFLLDLVPPPYEIALTTQQEVTNDKGDRFIYLEPAVAKFIKEIAVFKKTSLDEIVNAWLKRDIELIESVK
ncbi:hypothetical protein PN36_34800 [Candidatus Thiomargarita nelsonii]|uniref:Uncharacterized protein n=1 Tax=Candidatus Thiomargarita nelsonii TaxID=1003181 RepID=A0A4E0QJL3_9GAMM|nr:hypothetical protein PN36_34800 [Candidatus Thiomargarita nelsonii]